MLDDGQREVEVKLPGRFQGDAAGGRRAEGGSGRRRGGVRLKLRAAGWMSSLGVSCVAAAGVKGRSEGDGGVRPSGSARGQRSRYESHRACGQTLRRLMAPDQSLGRPAGPCHTRPPRIWQPAFHTRRLGFGRSGGRGSFPVHAPRRFEPEKNRHGSARFLDAPAPRGRRPLRPSGPPLEPEDGSVHLRHPQQHPHPRSRPDGADAAPRAAGDFRHGRSRRPRALRGHQAPGRRRRGRCGQALGAVLRELPLAGRHAHQLEDDLRLDPASAQGGRDPGRRRSGPHEEGAPDARREKEKLERALGGIRTWAARPT